MWIKTEPGDMEEAAMECPDELHTRYQGLFIRVLPRFLI